MPRILVADDNANIQKMVALALEEHGIDVVSVGNGEAAVRRIPDLTPDLVLADVFMPVRNGYEVCEFVKKDERFSHVPVILLVGAFDPLDEKEARRVGADGVLKKPFVPPDPLIAMVTSALEKNPKLAAELAREREAAQAKPAELPPIALEPPARTAPKPLPDFPEPSPEEAALIYGFKKPADGPADETAPARFSSPKGQQSQEEFDESTTAGDWRRNAANFEVPDELGAKPAFSTDEDFGPVVFPSERDVPTRRVTDDEEHPKPHASRGFEPALPMEPVEEETSREHAAPFAQTKPSAPSAPTAPARSEESAPRRTASSESEYSEEGWMSSLLGKFRRSKSAKEESDSKEEAAIPAEQPIAASRDSAPAADDSHSGAAEERVPAALESWFAPHPPVLDNQDSEPSHASSSSAFSSETTNDLMSAPADLGAPERQPHQASRAAGFPWSSGTSDSSESEEHDAYPYSRQQARADSAREEASPAHDETESSLPMRGTGAKDSALHSFLPPAPVEHSADPDSADDPAVHNAPSAPIFASSAPMPWAIDEASRPEADAGERIPTTPPPNREALAGIPFLTPPQAEPEAEAIGSAQAESVGDSSTQLAANGFGSHSAPSQAPAFSESAPATREPVAVESTTAPSVDAVVARLLEKLEPQLHQLLAKDLLKPLVENFLHQELENKSK